MKRKSDGPRVGSPKRQRQDEGQYGGRQGHMGYRPHDAGAKQKRQDMNGRPYHTQVTKQNKPLDVSQSAQSQALDPLLSLESILKAMVEKAEAVQCQLGPAALDHAKGLLESLSCRKKTAKTSLDTFHPDTLEQKRMPPFYAGDLLRAYPLPPLPQVPSGPWSTAAFTHKSFTGNDRVIGSSDLTYERLEFLGDAYIEAISTRIIFSRYPHFAAGRQAQVREQLVKNETLLQFSKAYNFQTRLLASPQETHGASADAQKGTGKILADVFEAYVAAVILSDPETGFERAERWLTELWAPILLQLYGPESANPLEGKYDPGAKSELQRRVLLAQCSRLDYLAERPMELAKGTQRYFIGVYLSGWGYEKRFLGKGEGQNKVEAGNRAAMDALKSCAEVVEDAERQMLEWKRKRKEAKEIEEAKKMDEVKEMEQAEEREEAKEQQQTNMAAV